MIVYNKFDSTLEICQYIINIIVYIWCDRTYVTEYNMWQYIPVMTVNNIRENKCLFTTYEKQCFKWSKVWMNQRMKEWSEDEVKS